MELIWDLLLKANSFCTGGHFTQVSARWRAARPKPASTRHLPGLRVVCSPRHRSWGA